MAEPTIAQKFKYNVGELIGLVEDTLKYMSSKGVTIPFYGVVMGAGKAKVEETDEVELIEGFIRSSIPFWPAIKTRKEEDMAQHIGLILGKLPEGLANMVQGTLKMKQGGELVIAPETMNAIWEYLESLVTLSVRYIHEKRAPALVDGKMQYTNPTYADGVAREGEPFIPKVVVREMVELWQIKM